MTETPSVYVRNLAGQAFGRLTVESYAGVKGSGIQHAYWSCRCECGNFRDVRGTNLVRGNTVECVPCARRTAGRNGRLKRSLPGNEGTFRRVFGTYRCNAAKKGIRFALDREVARRLFLSPCFYCGIDPSGVQRSRRGGEDFAYNGIDRVDNGRGYEGGNVVPCCAMCNYAKRDMTTVQFLTWVERVHSYQSGKGQ